MRTRKPNSDALYVHIPFCAHLCHYCDFTKRVYDAPTASLYVDRLIQEISDYDVGQVTTIYLGGGTPTVLDDTQLERVLAALAPHLKENGEFTVEANVENVTLQKLRLMRTYGVNRLSIGVQTFDDAMLVTLNRFHRGEDAKEAVRLAQHEGFDRISIDLMYGLPGMTLEHVRRDLDAVLSLQVGHVSCYALSVVPGTIFFRRKIPEATQENSRDQYDLILKTLRDAGYQRYEVSNFARKGQTSRHNRVYWDDREYYGVGLGASGFLNGIRYTNTSKMSDYLQGKIVLESETVTRDIDENDFLMLKLRLEEGFLLNEFAARFQTSFLDKYKLEVETLVKRGLLRTDAQSVACTDDGLMLLDTVLLKLFKR